MSSSELEALKDTYPPKSSPPQPADPPIFYYEYRLDPVCHGRQPGSVEGNMCELSAESCDGHPGNGPYMAVVRRVVRTADDEPETGWSDLNVTCFPEVAPGRSGQVADERIAKAFTVTKFALPVPATDPPRTDPLVNKPVYFTTDFAEAGYESGEIRTIPPAQMLGRDLKIMPELKNITYDYGDGTTHGPTTDTGAPYPDGTITHTYETTDSVQPRITATYTGRYSLDGGPWRPLGIDVEVTGNPITLTPTEYTTELVQPPT
ncbi:hypothetical protein [Kytococcus sedentarius]|uniref:hypothetical protein n=1 Tax=Kytococcus sedentarius TaxID=1276 RepID=UPI001950C1BF|nr:hypothetical protein [Kytococcus sedentarius]QRO87397.1 hypothetical protein I6J30_11460 [Kytococcus sedentarius]